MEIKQGLLYSKSHEWLLVEGDKAKVGISDHAQHELGDLVFINLPLVGDTVAQSAILCDVESVKAVSDIYSPVAGTVCAVNEDLEDNPALLNEKCYEAWICELDQLGDTSHLLDAAAYQEFIAKEG